LDRCGGVERFVAIAAWRSLFRVAELIELASQIEVLEVGVERTRPPGEGGCGKLLNRCSL
jgi:hypothetical protein